MRSLTRKLCERLLLKVNIPGDPCILRMLAGMVQNKIIRVISENAQLKIGLDRIHRLPPGSVPFFLWQVGPLLTCKLSIKSRCDVASKHGSFNRDRATAAKWIHQESPGIPEAQLNQSRSQGFL